MNILLWIAQGLLAVMYTLTGTMKLFAIEKARAQNKVFASYSETAIRAIGAAEVAGILGMILPMLTGILPWLTPLAAIGLTLIQLLAIFTVRIPQKEYKTMPLNIVLIALSIFVLIGRWGLLTG